MQGEDNATELELTASLQFLPGVGGDRAQKLAKLGLRNVRDLLFFFPRDYEFPAPSVPVDRLREGVEAALVGVITDAEIVSRTPGKSVFGAIVETSTGSVRILFFNQPFRAETLTFDRKVMISGAPKLTGLRWEFVHPKVTILDGDEAVPKPQILPIYALTDGIKQADLRKLTDLATASAAHAIREVMPESLRRQSAIRLRHAGINVVGDLPDIATALRAIHRPDSKEAIVAARTRFIFQELLVMQLALAIRRRRLTSALQAPVISRTGLWDARIKNRFPFELTGDQQRVIDEVCVDMSRQFPMNRMLQGDVGSGKTVVAVYAMMLAVANGYQAVLMAPTEVLARQHFRTLQKMLDGSRVRVGLLCGSLTAAERRDVLAGTAAGEIDLLVGTQALLFSIEFAKLGLCVIDEQHKFGVRQRVQLRGGGIDPHYLVMSATPIPRSVAMTMFGDVELSTLNEKPPGRCEVNTYLAHDGWKERWWQFVKERLAEGRQAYVVAPRVSPDERNTERNTDQDAEADSEDGKEDVSSVLTVFENLRSTVFADHRVALLHGRLSNEEKQSVMDAFAAGEIDVLVSTTVIEVGIDVPNATVMAILGAERFGLAQLHQLRGRVSRGTHAGHVALFTDGAQAASDNERLQVLEKTDDGFEIAEADFRMRGPGDMLGQRQSGLPPLRIASLVEDQEILAVARAVAQEMIDDDPEMDDPSLADLKQQMMKRYEARLSMGDTA
ncbi:ATP-dependent DNA helicase RecG [Stieleria varia]|uniref:Probable DNA 3'-5' helicase RecG n=2 Tax=Stieleria varia TaxID=2528005 RepID=A0A5C6B0D8_9BACT|nr:ATP-dependent DNA helicase RecG [Stieleria varia]